mgnify:CR=1 FL=1
MLIGRHSFIRQSKLSDVEGRIDYISNPKRQEYLYATYQTEGVTPEFWKNLARENQLDFKASGSAGKCIEGREFIIALPESFVQYRAGDVVRLFTETFHKRYGVECSAALHHNKTKTNYHIHLVFSERKMLEQPEGKIATRNMFYDEQGKHRRTKKEILDEQGNIRAGCNIIPKGEVYESHIFTKKEEWFKSKAFTKEVKELFTDTINCYVKEESEKLSVFKQGGAYLATKKIGKNNPKAEEIKADNAARQEWNRTVDVALAEGITNEMVMEIKRKEITDKVALSVAKNGRQPGLLRMILTAAVRFLAEYIGKIQMPPKPKLKIDIEEFRQMQTAKEKLDKQISLIRHTENVELPKLEENLQDIKGLFKGKEKKAAQGKIDQCKKRLSGQKDQLKKIVRESGYVTVKSFMENYDRAYGIVSEYQRELRRWEQQTGNGKKDMKQETVRQKESIRAKLKKNVQLVKEREQGKKVVRKKDRGGR